MSAERTVADEVLEAGQELSVARGENAVEILNRALNRFVVGHFESAPGSVIDCDDVATEKFAAVVHLHGVAANAQGAFPADATAAVIEVVEELTLESLRSAYGRIARAKSLRKQRPVEGPQRSSTVGIVIARSSALPFETIAEELDRLNATTPDHQWLDLVAVLPSGAIGYSVQFPGSSQLGTFMLPGVEAKSDLSPPIYVLSVVWATGSHTFNKVLSFLTGHLIVFASGAKPPTPAAIMERVPDSAMTLNGYQYNLNGELVPVPRQFYNDRLIPQRPFLIEDPKGKVLGALQFLPWQGGGVILLQGKLPLDGLLVFLGKKGMQRTLRLPEVQLSYVLPISNADFTAFLNALQQRSNMKVRADPGRFVVQKFADEGANSPFFARLMLGILRLRDSALPGKTAREEFDKLFDFLLSSLLSARTSAQKIQQLWQDHARKVASGEIVRRQGNQVQIGESVDRDLRNEIETFLNSAVRALKSGLQHLAAHLKIDVGFLFQKQPAFERGIAELEKSSPDLAAYLRAVRIWSEPVLKARIDLEHSLWSLPRVVYTPTDNDVRLGEPDVAGTPVSEFVASSLDRLICFAEDLVAHGL